MRKFLLSLSAIIVGFAGTAQTGGPDAFGYMYENSTTANVDFGWVEINPNLGGSGTMSSMSFADDSNEWIEIGFGFPFYGHSLDSVSISSNGTIYFENQYLGLSNVCSPGNPGYFTGDTVLIAHAWDDLNPSSGGSVYYQRFSNMLIVQYDSVVEFGGSDGDTWQIIMYDDGSVDINYKEASFIAASTGLTIGVQGSTTEGLEYMCNGTGDYLGDSLTIRFWEPTTLKVPTQEKGELSVYPNPSNGTFNVSGTSIDEIMVYDYAGKLVYSDSFSGDNLVNLDLSYLPAGFYQMAVSSEGSLENKKIIIE